MEAAQEMARVVAAAKAVAEMVSVVVGRVAAVETVMELMEVVTPGVGFVAARAVAATRVGTAEQVVELALPVVCWSMRSARYWRTDHVR